MLGPFASLHRVRGSGCSAAPASSGILPGPLAELAEKITVLRRRLATPLGTINEPYRHGQLDRGRLLTDIAARLHTGLGASAVVLNETVLRTTVLGDVLTLADLLTVEPFDNQLVHAFLPRPVHGRPCPPDRRTDRADRPLGHRPRPVARRPGHCADHQLPRGHLPRRTPSRGRTRARRLRPPHPRDRPALDIVERGNRMILTGPEIATAARDGRLTITHSSRIRSTPTTTTSVSAPPC